MATIPLVDQGTLNRLVTHVIFPNNSTLNATASYMGRRQVEITFDGNATTPIATATGATMSPEPYIQVNIVLNLLKTQGLSAAWRAQQELSSILGPVTVYLDATAFPEYNFNNAAILGPQQLTGAGSDNDYTVRIVAYYPINSNLYI